MEKTLKKIISILEKTEGIKAYALIGGLALGGWVSPRATKDIDLLVDLSNTSHSAIEKGLFKRLQDSGFKGSLETGGPEDDIKFCIKSVSSEGIPVDIIFVDKKWEGEIVEGGISVEVLKDISLPVARPEGLIVLKLKAGSFQDVADASRLLIEAEYDLQKLLSLAKRAKVDKRLERIMKKLELT
ncbi:MAG: nucleotidyl transferase AbiEii/AbiGii toxin family protein [Nitrospirae bacterium]|nr:nucleotidyl transferase AbiEii/AbiGii toxin family protein [Nitrospirota bacterium]